MVNSSSTPISGSSRYTNDVSIFSYYHEFSVSSFRFCLQIRNPVFSISLLNNPHLAQPCRQVLLCHKVQPTGCKRLLF